MALAKDSSLTGGSLRGVAGGLVQRELTVSFAVGLSGTSSGGSQNDSTQPDGSNVIAKLTVPAALPNGAVLKDHVYGTVVGIRVKSDSATPPFDVVIDGVAYPVDSGKKQVNNTAATSGIDPTGIFMIAENLPKARHNVEVHVNPNPDGATSNILTVYGFVAESGVGYAPRGQRIAGTPTPAGALLPSAAAQIAYGGVTAAVTLRNTDLTSPHDWTITQSDGSTVWLAGTLPAGGVDCIPLPAGPRQSLSGYKWFADAANVVRGILETVG
jgi:hypothetical protein